MIDIHSHVLPGVDDGAQTMEDSLELLAQAADSGVHTLVATPHCNIPDEFENFAGPELDELFLRLDKARQEAGIPLRLCRGMEVFATYELPALLRDGRVWTLNGTRYFLMEFAFQEDPDYCREILRRCRELDYLPIIAHPERYDFVQDDPEDVYAFIENELKYAISVLPYASDDTYRASNDFRISKGGAMGLLAKVYATWAGYPLQNTAKWEDCAKICKTLVESGKHSLLPDYEDLWKNAGSSTPFIMLLLSRSGLLI